MIKRGLSDLIRFLETVYVYFLSAFYFRILILYITDFNPKINKDYYYYYYYYYYKGGGAISLTPLYHSTTSTNSSIHRHLDIISQAITAESSPLNIASNQTRTGNLWFPSANR